MAPEMLLKRPKYDNKIDIWALGVILYVMVFGRFPFTGKNEDDYPKNGKDKIFV